MPFIRTVLGDIDPGTLGVCYAHEHIIIDPSFTTFRYPDFLLDSVELACVDVRAFYEAGGRAMVDSMPCAAGRNVLKLAQISRKTGVHIVCPTGLHLSLYYPPGHWSQKWSSDRLADLFLAEITDGIDAADCNGPNIERTPHRAGVIKIASGLNGPSESEKRVFESAASAHLRSGCPILTHTEKGTGAIEQIRLLASLGVDLGHVVISHTDRKPDFVYHQEILSTGVLLEYDSAFRWPPESGNPTCDLVVRMCESGFAGQILLGMDAARRKYWRAYGGLPGLTFLLADFTNTLLSAGLAGEHLHQIFIKNPAGAYTFRTREAEGRISPTVPNSVGSESN